MGRAWDLRPTIRGRDAINVPLAQALNATLITFDRRPAEAPAPEWAPSVRPRSSTADRAPAVRHSAPYAFRAWSAAAVAWPVVTPERVRIGLLGCGNVGAALVELIDQRSDAIAARTGLRLEVTRVAVRSLAKERPVELSEGVLTLDAAGPRRSTRTSTWWSRSSAASSRPASWCSPP